jgi:hypothetical protein
VRVVVPHFTDDFNAETPRTQRIAEKWALDSALLRDLRASALRTNNNEYAGVLSGTGSKEAMTRRTLGIKEETGRTKRTMLREETQQQVQRTRNTARSPCTLGRSFNEV